MSASETDIDLVRHAAWVLDALSKLTRVLYEPIALGADAGASEVTVTCELTKHGEPMSPEDARKLLDWVGPDEMQAGLRRLADRLEAHRCGVFPSWLSEWESPEDATDDVDLSNFDPKPAQW